MNSIDYPIVWGEFRFDEIANFQERNLFYPCSACDIIGPVKLFSPWVQTFWFVDVGYFEHQNPLDTSPAISDNHYFQLLDRDLKVAKLPEDDWVIDPKYHEIPPYILTEIYNYLPSMTVIYIHRHRRRGPSALRKEIDRLAVFFYRGDSDEGSSAKWLTSTSKLRKRKSDLPSLIIEKLVNKGLFVTDGSHCWLGKNPYSFFLSSSRDFGDNHRPIVKTYEDIQGNKFECVGAAGERWERVSLIWKVSKANN